MKIDIRPGKYVVAVSGGVDSMVLLHVLAHMADNADDVLQIVVAHYDHGIREDSSQDRKLVEAQANRYELPYIYEEGRLGAGTSEARAREARYAFLRRVRTEQGADAIVTAHHQDDALETAIINMKRGTGSRGLSSLRTGGDMVRPLLGLTKAELLAYARRNGVQWREDSTNSDERYLRNYVRSQVIPKMSEARRAALLQSLARAAGLNDEIDALLAPYTSGRELGRRWFVQLPHMAARETMATWLRRHGVAFDRKTVERLVVFAKTALPGKTASVDRTHHLTASKEHITIVSSL